MTISTLDIASFTDANPEERKKFNDDLLSSLERYGFVKFVNHGISDQSVKDIFHWVGSPDLQSCSTIDSNGQTDSSHF